MTHKPTYEELVRQVEKLEQQVANFKESEKLLRQNEEQFRRMYENAPLPYQSLNETGYFLDVNKKWIETLGYEKGEVVGQWFGDFLSSTSVAHFDRNFPIFKNACVIDGVEFEMVKKNGEIINVFFNGRVQLDEKNQFVRTHCIFTDITEQKRVIQALRQSEERLGETARIAKLGGWEIDLQGNTLAWTEETFRIHELDTQRPPDVAEAVLFYHPDDQYKVAAAVKRSIESGETFDFEARLITAKKNQRWVRAIGKAAYRDGRLAGIRGMVQDITEHKQMVEALRESETYIKAVMDNLPIGVAVNSVDPDVAFSYMNDNFPKIYRTTREALSKTDAFWDAVYEEPAYRRQIRDKVLADCASGDPERMHWEDVPITREGKRTAYVSAKNTPVPGKNLMISTVWDVTERKLAEEDREKLHDQLAQAQKMESIGRLAGGVAHDFNNMLSVILGFAEMILEKMGPDQPIYADLQEIQKAARRSADITRQLLAFARKQTVAPRVLDLNKTVESMLRMLQRLIGEDIELSWLPGRELARVRIDPSQMDQILANLCVNARDAIKNTGKITIETGNAAFDEEYCSHHAGYAIGDYVLLAVSDNGCGMDRQILDHLFEPFFTTKGVDKGTGLGLATVYGIVKQNEGFINVYSEPGQGTTIRIYFPQHHAKADAFRETTKDRAVERGCETILLVEDEPAILRMTKMMLERLDYHVLPARTPGEALGIARAHAGEIHLLVTDVVMPEMNGRDLAQQLLSRYPDMKRLFMSGYTADVIVHHGVLDKGVNFIQKPFSKETLGTKVRNALDGEMHNIDGE